MPTISQFFGIVIQMYGAENIRHPISMPVMRNKRLRLIS